MKGGMTVREKGIFSISSNLFLISKFDQYNRF